MVLLREKLLIFGAIYIGTVCYTIASYYHLKFENWNFWKALSIAIPFVLLEYSFSLNGNHLAHTILQLNAVQILMITMCFYFINTWILNNIILGHTIVAWREITSLGLVLLALYITNYKTMEPFQ